MPLGRLRWSGSSTRRTMSGRVQTADGGIIVLRLKTHRDSPAEDWCAGDETLSVSWKIRGSAS